MRLVLIIVACAGWALAITGGVTTLAAVKKADRERAEFETRLKFARSETLMLMMLREEMTPEEWEALWAERMPRLAAESFPEIVNMWRSRKERAEKHDEAMRRLQRRLDEMEKRGK